MFKIHTLSYILFNGVNGGLLVLFKIPNNVFVVTIVFVLVSITILSYQTAAGL